MIDRVLKVLVEEELNQFLARRQEGSSAAGAKLGLPSLSMNKADGSSEDTVVASLINLEQERIDFNVSSSTSPLRKNRPQLINAYVLFIANHRDYVKALEQLSNTLAFFQSKAVFTPANTPSLSSGIEKVTVEMVNMDLQDLGSFWTSIGNDIPPAAIFKIRSICMTEDMILGELPDITRTEQYP